MSIEHEAARINLNKQDTVIMKNVKILNPGTIYNTFEVRGGHGNRKLACFDSIENRILKSMRDSLIKDTDEVIKIDYSDPSTFPKEWSNICWGRDTVKFSQKDIILIKRISMGSLSGIVTLLGLIKLLML